MKTKKLLILSSLFFLPLSGCSSNNNNSTYDPFLIGDNLEVISDTEAELVSNEAFSNLMYTSSLRQSSNIEEDSTKFYTGAFSNYAQHTKSTNESEAIFYSNKVETNRDIVTTTYFGNDTAVEDRNTFTTDWYGYKPQKEGEPEPTTYSLLTKTVDKYNGISSTRYSASDNFATKENVGAIWNLYLVNSISKNLQNDISYSSHYTYVRDNQHIVGYYLRSQVVTEPSKIAPGKDDASYVKKIEDAFVIDFYNDEVLGIGWTVKTVSYRSIVSYLNTIDGKETEPIVVSNQVDVTSFYYDISHQFSEDLPEFELKNTIMFSISKFAFNEEETSLDYVTNYELDNNNDFYEHIEDSFSGHAYYKEQKLSVGFYSFFDKSPSETDEYEKWGFDDIKSNKCANYIIKPSDAPINENQKAIIETHEKLFYVAEEATFAFRIVFDENMTTATEFSVATIGR